MVVQEAVLSFILLPNPQPSSIAYLDLSLFNPTEVSDTQSS